MRGVNPKNGDGAEGEKTDSSHTKPTKRRWFLRGKKDRDAQRTGERRTIFKKLFQKKSTTSKNKKGSRRRWANTLFWILLIYLVLSFGVGGLGNQEVLNPTISEVVSSIQAEKVASIEVSGKRVTVTYADDTVGELQKDSVASFDETLANLGVTTGEFARLKYSVVKEGGFGYWMKQILPFLFPLLIFGVFLWFIMRQSKGMGGMQVFQFGRSRARFVNPDDEHGKVSFKDVAGLVEAKQELQEFVEFLKQPDRFLSIGAKVPKGVMLTGAPGTGKTLLARAVAGEARVPFFSISGSEFVEMFVGVGASRVRDLFSMAKKSAPSIVFIDEIDAVGRARGTGLGGGNDEREQALNQILVEMDGFEQTDKVIVLASTNRPDILDNALLRPGRFDRKIVIDLPDIKERTEILQVHARGKKMEEDVSFETIARRTPGLSGADLASVVNEGAIFAVRDSRKSLCQKDLLAAIEKVMLGPERKGRVITKREKRMIAYHEAGHALLASLLPYADPVQKITIVSRGHAGGYVLSLPDFERRLKTRKEFVDTIIMALGGYSAEQLVFGDVSTGPSSDLVEVSRLAHDMVTRFGMSDVVGPVAVRQPNYYGVVGGREGHSQDLEKQIDAEVDKIIKHSYDSAFSLLKKNRESLDSIVKKLLEEETLEREEFEALLQERGVEVQNAFKDDEEERRVQDQQVSEAKK
ncbi:MAG: ATP-dependent zinc metalloprotease FtsH [Candidatus Kaiserbacteria bacterium]|nr:ATP-dependent zinc metalloprotease FtsH [Candidatus Kaiserbacteria bacterium]